MQGYNPNRDTEVTNPPTDSISSLTFSPKANLLIGTSWDNQVRCWEISNNGQSVLKAQTNHDGPVLCSSWSGDGTKVFTGSCDTKAKCWVLQTNQSIVVGTHSAPIKSVFWMDEMQCLVTASWDKTLKYWDGRSPNPAHTAMLPERAYTMDVKYPLAVVGTGERHIVIYDLRKPNAEFKRFPSPLKFQSRVVSCFPDKSGFALGSIEGRVAIHHVEDKDNIEGNEIYSVNVICFHPIHGTFATAGSDGSFNFWDKDSKQRLKPFSRANAPITCGNFNGDGSIFAYAVSYDWSKGVEYYNQYKQSYILLHSVQESEIRSRKK